MTTKEPLINLPSPMNLTVTVTNLVDSTKNTLNITLNMIETNKHAPMFTEDFLEFYLPDNSPKSKVVGTLRPIPGTDNSQIEYTFVDDSKAAFFNISKSVSFINSLNE